MKSGHRRIHLPHRGHRCGGSQCQAHTGNV